MAEFIHRRDFLSAEKGEETCVKGWLWLSAGISKKGGPGVGKYEGRIQISLRRRTRGGIEKVFGTRQQETSKSVPFPPPEYKWNVLTYWRLYRSLVDTYQFAREIRLSNKKRSLRKKEKEEKLASFLDEHEERIEFWNRVCKILQT